MRIALLVLAACGAPATRAPVIYATSGAARAPLACGRGQEIDRRGCGPAADLARCPGGVDVAPAPPLRPSDGPVLEEEGLRIRAQLVQSDASLTGPLRVRQVLRADVDGDDKPDAVYVAAMPGLEAVVMHASTFPARLRILQFSDTERYELLGAIDLDPARPGRQLVLRTTSAAAAEIQIVRPTGEVVGDLRCLTSP